MQATFGLQGAVLLGFLVRLGHTMAQDAIRVEAAEITAESVAHQKRTRQDPMRVEVDGITSESDAHQECTRQDATDLVLPGGHHPP